MFYCVIYYYLFFFFFISFASSFHVKFIVQNIHVLDLSNYYGIFLLLFSRKLFEANVILAKVSHDGDIFLKQCEKHFCT